MAEWEPGPGGGHDGPEPADTARVGRAMWAAIAGADAAAPVEPAAARAWAGRLSEIIPPALAAHVLDRGVGGPGAACVDPAAARQSLLFNRLVRARQLECLAEAGAAGAEPVVLKGLANAYRYYREPDARVAGDLDILLRGAERERLITHLAALGYRFRPAVRRPWGSISTASLAPFMSPDGLVNLDIHVHPDSFPVHRSLTTDDVFDRARPVAGAGVSFRAPCATHSIVLLAGNAARDKFGPFAVTKVLDALALLRAEAAPDWDEVERYARDGGYLTPLRAFCLLLLRLGLSRDRVAPHLARPFRGAAAGEFERMAAAWALLFPRPAGAFALMRREWLLSAEPAVALTVNLRRFTGLLRPAGRSRPESGVW